MATGDIDKASDISLQKLTPIRGRKLSLTALTTAIPTPAFTEATPDKGTKTN